MINKDRWTTASICSTLVGFSLSDPSLQNSTPRCPEKCGPPLTLFSLWPLIIKPLKWVTLMGMSLSHTSILDPYPLFVSVSWLLACRKCNRFWCMQHATALNKNIRVLREKKNFSPKQPATCWSTCWSTTINITISGSDHPHFSPHLVADGEDHPQGILGNSPGEMTIKYQ